MEGNGADRFFIGFEPVAPGRIGGDQGSGHGFVLEDQLDAPGLKQAEIEFRSPGVADVQSLAFYCFEKSLTVGETLDQSDSVFFQVGERSPFQSLEACGVVVETLPGFKQDVAVDQIAFAFPGFHQQGYESAQIAQLVQISEALVGEYLAIWQENDTSATYERLADQLLRLQKRNQSEKKVSQ